jgi:acyl CoA:acetate/3-ketoacid CoA transferase
LFDGAAKGSNRHEVIVPPQTREGLRNSFMRRKLAGVGGFINISQNAKEVIFVGAIGAGRQKVGARDGKLVIDEEAKRILLVRDASST